MAADTPAQTETENIGPFDLGEGLTPMDVWQGIHASVPVWIASAGLEAGQNNRDKIDQGDLVLLKALQNFPAQRWVSICDGIGWTTYGAIASSWCKGAHLKGVLFLWLKALNGNEPGELELRPARFLNPVLLPEPALTSLFEAVKDMPSAWLLLAAHKGRGADIKNDLSEYDYGRLNSALKSLLC